MADLDDNAVIAERMNERRALADKLQNDAEFREKYMAEEKRAREAQAETDAAEELARLTREYMGETAPASASASAESAPVAPAVTSTSTHVALPLDDPLPALPELPGQFVIHNVTNLVINMCSCKRTC